MPRRLKPAARVHRPLAAGFSLRMEEHPLFPDYLVNVHQYAPICLRRYRIIAHLRCRILNRSHDIVVAGAAAQVAFKAMAHFIIGWIRVLLQQIVGGNDHAWCAIAALQAVAFPEPFLKWVQLAIGGQTLDCCDFGSIGLNCQYGAGFHTLAVHKNDTRATLAGIAADMGSGEIKALAQVVNQQRPRLNIVLVGSAIHFYGDRGHVEHLLIEASSNLETDIMSAAQIYQAGSRSQMQRQPRRSRAVPYTDPQSCHSQPIPA